MLDNDTSLVQPQIAAFTPNGVHEYIVNLSAHPVIDDIYIETTLNKPHSTIILPFDFARLDVKVLDQLNANRITHRDYLESCRFFCASDVSPPQNLSILTEQDMVELKAVLNKRAKRVIKDNSNDIKEVGVKRGRDFNEFPSLDTVRGVQVVFDFTNTLASDDTKIVVTPNSRDIPINDASVVVLSPTYTVNMIMEARKVSRRQAASGINLDSTCAVIYFDEINGYVVESDRNVRNALIKIITRDF